MKFEFILKKFLLSIFIVSLSANVSSADTEKKAEKLFDAGLQAIEKDDYSLAVVQLEKAVEATPQKSEYHRWLGRAYGLSAEQAPWFKGIGLAKKAHKSFEKSVEVDPANINALLDLREFYLQAPSFVGGSKGKAKKVTQELEKLGYKVEHENTEEYRQSELGKSAPSL